MGTADWRRLLADPYRQWRRTRSAWELAVSWERHRNSESGLPPEISAAFDTEPDLGEARLLLAIPEHRVVLDDERRPSQNDLWAVVRTRRGVCSVAVEAKAGEEFDKPLEEWNTSVGTAKRLKFLRGVLNLIEEPPSSLRYQLLHRTASAVLEARRWGLAHAVMLVQVFGESKTSWTDFVAFAACLGAGATRNRVTAGRPVHEIQLYVGWVDSLPSADGDAVAAI